MIQPVILAAGKGTRMKSDLPKTLHEVKGKPMLEWILSACKEAGYGSPVIVVGHNKEQVISRFPQEIYAHQEELTGTASAVRAALPHLSPDTEAILILYGDQPFVEPESLKNAKDTYQQKKPALLQSVVRVPDYEGWRSVFVQFGRIIRADSGQLIKITEHRNATEEERALTEVNPGTCIVALSWFKEIHADISPNPANGEFYLTELVSLAHQSQKNIETIELSPIEALGPNSREDIETTEKVVQDSK